MMFTREGIRPWEISRLTIEQLHTARYTFDAMIAEAAKNQ